MVERVTVEEGRRLLAKSQGTQPESLILNQCRDYLRALGWLVVRHQQGLGSFRGLSDLTAIKDGRVVWIECKTAKGKLSVHQEAFRDAILAAGGEYAVVRCVEDAAKIVRGIEC